MPTRLSDGAPTKAFPYWKELAAVLCLKILALGLIYSFFFAPSHRPAIDQRAVADHLLTEVKSPTEEEANHAR